MTKYLPLSECKDGFIYVLKSRNLLIGVYREKSRGFVGIRKKFMHRFLDEEIHYDASKSFGTAKPIKEIGEKPSFISSNIGQEKNEELFKLLDSYLKCIEYGKENG